MKTDSTLAISLLEDYDLYFSTSCNSSEIIEIRSKLSLEEKDKLAKKAEERLLELYFSGVNLDEKLTVFLTYIHAENFYLWKLAFSFLKEEDISTHSIVSYYTSKWKIEELDDSNIAKVYESQSFKTLNGINIIANEFSKSGFLGHILDLEGITPSPAVQKEKLVTLASGIFEAFGGDLTILAKHPNRSARDQSVWILGCIGTDTKKVKPILKNLMNYEPDDQIRQNYLLTPDEKRIIFLTYIHSPNYKL